MAIFVDVIDTQIRVSGDTFQLAKALGGQGLGFKFDRNEKVWKGPLSLKALEFLQGQSGAILTTPALDEMAAMQRSAIKKAAYMRSKQ